MAISCDYSGNGDEREKVKSSFHTLSDVLHPSGLIQYSSISVMELVLRGGFGKYLKVNEKKIIIIIITAFA
jgi:hypothetical protein